MDGKLTKGLTAEDLKAQALRCTCRGADDYCVCQNVPDSVTRKEWGLREPIPSGYYNLLDLLEKIARPDLDPTMDIADGLTLMDYWRSDAARLIPIVKQGGIVIDETLWRLLHDASFEAQRQREMRQEYRSASANFPSMVKIPHAQDAATMIDRLIAAFKLASRAEPPNEKRPKRYTVNLSEQELDVLEELAKQQDLSPGGVLRQGLKHYQMLVHGPVDLGPMLPPTEPEEWPVGDVQVIWDDPELHPFEKREVGKELDWSLATRDQAEIGDRFYSKQQVLEIIAGRRSIEENGR